MSELSSTDGSEAVQANGFGSGALLEPEEAWAGMNEQARKRATTIISGKEKADVVRTIAISENAVRDREVLFGNPQDVEIPSVQYSGVKKAVLPRPGAVAPKTFSTRSGRSERRARSGIP
jgi:hypothetical protein